MFFRRLSVAMPVSQDLLKAMQQLRLTMHNVDIIPNVVDARLFHPVDKKPNTVPIIAHVAELKDEHKNISGLFRALAVLHQNGVPFLLKITGQGDALSYFKEWARTLGIAAQVQFVGRLSSHEVAHLMQEADVLVLFSHYENLPCVIAEAHCTGLPVVASAVNGIPEMIDPTNGITVPAADEGALADALQKVLTHQVLFSPLHISSQAVARYSYSGVAQSFLSVYHQVIHAQA